MNALCLYLCLSVTFATTLAGHFCYDGGKIYKPGDRYVSADCSGRCTCRKGRAVGCVSLCPPSSARCNYNEVKVQSRRKIPNSHCSCPSYECLKPTDFCYDGGKKYKPGDRYVSADCAGYCTCHKGGYSCNSLCPPEGMTCSKDEIQIRVMERVLNSHCSCPKYRCRKYTKS